MTEGARDNGGSPPEPAPDASGATCRVCQPPQVIGAGILEHLRLFHPAEYGDGPACWPDGELVIQNLTLSPEDFAQASEPAPEMATLPRHELDALLAVATLYLDAFRPDEMMTLPEKLRLQDVEAIVERHGRRY